MVYLGKAVVVCSDEKMSNLDELLKALREFGKLDRLDAKENVWSMDLPSPLEIFDVIKNLQLEKSVFLIAITVDARGEASLWHNRIHSRMITKPIEQKWLGSMIKLSGDITKANSQIHS